VIDATQGQPLQGVRVLDLTRLLPGSYATLMLADLGADVIKIEDPRGGDHARHMPPLANGTSVYFTVLNRNKRSVAIDLRAPESAAILDALVPRCDVVVDSCRPRTAKRLGVDPDALRRRHPRVICASITGFGRTGPYADRAAHDINYEALAGLLSLGQPTADGPAVPQVPGMLLADIGAAYQATFRVLAALFGRERSQRTADIDVSIHEAALQWMVFPSARRLVDGADADPRQLPLRGEAARYNVYETADGQWLALGALEEKFWVAFCERIGRPDLGRLHDEPGAEQTRALDEVRQVMRTRTRDAWLAHFADVDVCLTAVNSLDEALADPHVAARGLVARVEGTTFIGVPAATIRPAPALGAQTDEVLGALGIGADDRRRLRESGVIR
jgi:crotonobetainyl-CoA:carnitine CoA-transferase CaiB-like acyl-CoA transferase